MTSQTQSAMRPIYADDLRVMTLVITGKLNKQVGFELGISEITVKAHRRRMMDKMKARSLPDLVIMNAKLDASAAKA